MCNLESQILPFTVFAFHYWNMATTADLAGLANTDMKWQNYEGDFITWVAESFVYLYMFLDRAFSGKNSLDRVILTSLFV